MTAVNKKPPFYKQRGFRLFLMLTPFMANVFILSYLPLYGWVYALFDYRPGLPLTAERFVGFKYFISMFTERYIAEDIVRVLGNTFAMSLLDYARSVLPMIFALLLWEIKFIPVRRVIQTLTTIPNFISMVLVYSIVFALFSVNDGFINRLLINLGLIDSGINFLASSNYILLKLQGLSVWKGLGWGAIIYFATLAGIDPELYEAARVDGAGRFSCMLHISLPGLMPAFIVMLILGIANFLNSGVDIFFLFQNPMNKKSIEVLDLYVYNKGIAGTSYGFSTAVSILKSIVSLVLLFSANSISKLVRGQSIF